MNITICDGCDKNMENQLIFKFKDQYYGMELRVSKKREEVPTLISAKAHLCVECLKGVEWNER